MIFMAMDLSPLMEVFFVSTLHVSGLIVHVSTHVFCVIWRYMIHPWRFHVRGMSVAVVVIKSKICYI
jgi:hypothetical protein